MASPPEWLTDLAKALSEHLVPAVLPAPLGAHVQQAVDADEQASDVWEISLFYGKTEIVGGPEDGRRTETAFWLDVIGAQRVLTRVDRAYWQTAILSPSDDLGPHVAVEGDYLGHPVRVRVLSAAPQQFPPARTADTNRGMFIDLW